MKEIQISETEYRLCEGITDLYDIRFPLFLSYLRMSVENIDKPLFKATMEKAIARADKGEFFKAIKEFQDYESAISLDQVSSTGLSKCFALICLEEGEDQVETDEGALDKKLDKMRQDGLTRGFVEESVSNFIKASPQSFGDYGTLIAMMDSVNETLLSKNLDLSTLKSSESKTPEKES